MSEYLDIKRHDETAYMFAEAVYQKMASKRYGVEFCCETDLIRTEIHMGLQELNDMRDIDLTACDLDQGSYSDDFSHAYDNEI